MKFMKSFFLVFSALYASAFGSNKTVAIYQQHPIAVSDCVNALKKILRTKYNVEIVTHNILTPSYLESVDCIVFPGGIGDADRFDDLLADKKKIIRDYVSDGGSYVGICMGSYFAGKYYFDLLGDVDAVQYIKRPNSNVKNQQPTTTKCYWFGKPFDMYFYDGSAFVGDIKRHQILAEYENGDIAGLCKKFDKGKVAVIGPHPEALDSWYRQINKKPLWHNGKLHKLLLNLFDNVLE